MASEFFTQLAEFSRLVLADFGFPSVCAWRTPGWPTGSPPRGLIVHYTGGSLKSALRWFMYSHSARASAHVVIGRMWPEAWRALAEGYPMVASLPAPAVQCVPLEDRAWHATWANYSYLGIELANHGEIRKDARGRWVFWAPEKEGAPEWTASWRPDGAVPGVEPVPGRGRLWEPYSDAQLLTCILVARAMRAVYPLDPQMFLGHEHIQQNKPDPGPAFPLAFMRVATFSPKLWESPLSGLGVTTADMEFIRSTRLIDDWATKHFPLVRRGDLQAAQDVLKRTLAGWEDATVWDAVKTTDLLLGLLGYPVSSSQPNTMPVQIFQRMMDLQVDSQVGRNTREALARRVQDLGVL